MKKRIVITILIICSVFLTACSPVNDINKIYKKAKYKLFHEAKFDKKISEEDKFALIKGLVGNNIYIPSEVSARGLCLTKEDLSLDGFDTSADLKASGLFNLTDKKVVEGFKLFERVYPASTTKIMTALIAINHKNLDEEVVVSSEVTKIEKSSTVARIKPGDKIKFKDLLYAMMLPSGNDAAVQIAISVSGSVEEFAKLMNEEAKKLGATQTNFVNSHGLHNENHYTTVYDMYLIFNEAIKNDVFKSIITTPSYEASIIRGGKETKLKWENTNKYLIDDTLKNPKVSIFGGKTGTTDEAGGCLVQYIKSTTGKEYIAIVMGTTIIEGEMSHEKLYNKMTSLIDLGII